MIKVRVKTFFIFVVIKVLLFNNLPHHHGFIAIQPHKINPAGQGVDVNGG
jgi:hypothetical protein